MTDAPVSRTKFSRQRVIVGAAEFADTHGADALTLAALAREHDALLYVDDAHGFGVIGERDGYDPTPYGRRGNAIVRWFGESYDRIVLTAGLSKAYSSLLAFVTCSGKRLGPGRWTKRTVWYAAPMV